MNEETYQLTPLGFLTSSIKVDSAERVLKELIEYCRMAGHNAIVLDEFPGQFINVEFKKDWDDEEN